MKLYLMCVVLFYNIAVEYAIHMTETYPPVHLASPLVLLRPGTCDLKDERNFDMVMLDGLVNLGKFPYLDQSGGILTIHMRLSTVLEMVLDMKFDANAANPCILRTAKYGMQEWCQFLKANNLIRIGAQLQVRQQQMEASFVLSYLGSNSSRLSSEDKRVQFPVYGNNYDKCKGSVPESLKSTNGSDRLTTFDCKRCCIYLAIGWLISLSLLAR